MRTLGIVMVWMLLVGSERARAVEVSGKAMLANRGVAKQAVIYLEGNAKSKPMTKVVIDQRDKEFIPHVTVITVGTTVEFPNNDTVFHNVFAYFQAKKFDLGMYPRGATKRVTFEKPGVVALLCNVHSEMSAYIMVVDTPYFAVTDRQGNFRIRDVPPGTYTLHAWHESGATLQRMVTIKGENVSLSLTLSR
jgi:plastocyanin